jgi:hypothetical protein
VSASAPVKTLVPVVIAVAVALVHLLTNHNYGFHRDELQVLSDARHLDWGFVPYPPLTPFVERIGVAIFGFSPTGLRLFSVIAQALAIVATGLMAREQAAGGWPRFRRRLQLRFRLYRFSRGQNSNTRLSIICGGC